MNWSKIVGFDSHGRERFANAWKKGELWKHRFPLFCNCSPMWLLKLTGWRMRMGTRSLLFGVHQFVWHPISVGLAWRKCYRCWPRWHEWIAIVCHDLGYWGMPNMDGPEGQTHPERGAKLAGRIAYRIARMLGYGEWAPQLSHEVESLSLYHSTHYAQKAGKPVSALYLPDKVSVLYDPCWWYLLRSRASGEVWEYIQNAPEWIRAMNLKHRQPGIWYWWYRNRTKLKLNNCSNLCCRQRC